MFEEAQVCMVCGRPVDSDRTVYCGETCATLDAAPSPLTSPSASGPSSAYPSPFLTSSSAVADDVPALVPSALGHRHTHSSSSNSSSVAWSNEDEPELVEDSKSPNQFYNRNIIHQQHFLRPLPHGGMMQYARRPSSTNNRSTVPLLLRHSSGTTATTSSASASASSFGGPASGKSMPSPLYTPFSSVDGTDDDAASSLCLSEEGDRQSHASSTPDQQRRRKTRNRASLPAYFSLLQSQASPSAAHSSTGAATSPAGKGHWRAPSALMQLSRSLQAASPTTPRVSHATVVIPAADFSHANSPVTSPAVPRREDTQPQLSAEEMMEERERGRGRPRKRETDLRSASSRRERQSGRSPPPRERDREDRHLFERERERTLMSAAQRARIDSVEKVAEWVSSSPVAAAGWRGRTRRRSAAAAAIGVSGKYEFVEALTRGLRGCAAASDEDENEQDKEEREQEEREEKEREMVRGRRRVHELDEPLRGDAPGLGGGRSGLRARRGSREGVERRR